MGKRLFDLVASGLGLLLLAPLLAVIALAIKLDSPGPVLFRQERVGRHGRPFRIRKFRTMRHAPAGGGLLITVGADPRITRVGAFLRSTKLDELPQLLDVLCGTMSLVGPRPEVPRYLPHYPPAVREKVLSVRPGITDIASIEYRRESELLAAAADPERAYVEEVLPAKLRYALQYVDNASFWGDLRLLARTLHAIVTR
ncbi:sugar transferase [Aquabacterium sp. A7-Y]|uniref:sugar transferase n=1 Tax=Aquabacterium sp. A7-Y TaxID=1349605 RepID=UPI00223E386B|nr:sugar transferase [Aquabacterium sp. A7-Y]MCW7541789.1 sugar transferase [Aquabacterium sp. A7-Y]